MPKTSVNEDRKPMLREHKVGLARQIFAMETKAEPDRMCTLTCAHFGGSILPSNT